MRRENGEMRKKCSRVAEPLLVATAAGAVRFGLKDSKDLSGQS